MNKKKAEPPEILDRHFIELPFRKKGFVILISLAYLMIAIIGYKTGTMSLLESFLIFVIGIIYTELIKLQYRIQNLENKKK